MRFYVGVNLTPFFAPTNHLLRSNVHMCVYSVNLFLSRIFATYQYIRDLVVEFIARTRFTLFEAMKAYITFTPRAFPILLYAHLNILSSPIDEWN